MSTPVRERSVKAPFSIRASTRTPSHLISKSQFGSEKGRSVSVANMGSTRDGIAILRAPWNSDAWIRAGLRLGGSSSLISSIVRPVSAEPSCSSMFQEESSAASLCLIINHSLPFSLRFSFTRTKLPRNFSLEVGVVQRMIFNVHRQPLVGVALGRSLGHGPGLQRPIDRQPEIVVQPRCLVLLNHERVTMLSPRTDFQLRQLRLWQACAFRGRLILDLTA